MEPTTFGALLKRYRMAAGLTPRLWWQPFAIK
jgi:hypothetical protein